MTLDGAQVIGSMILDDTSGSGLYGWLFNASSTNSSFGGSLTLSATGQPVVAVNLLSTAPGAWIYAPLAGTGGFDKQGQGSLILDNTNNPLSGAVSVSAGMLSVWNNNLSLPNISSVSVASGAQFRLGVSSGNGGIFTNGNSITLAGGGYSPGPYNLSSDLLTLGNNTTNYLTKAITLTGPATIGVNGIGTVCHLQGGVNGTGPLTLWLGNTGGSGPTQPDTLELESQLSHSGDTIFSYTISTAIVRLHNNNQLPTGGVLTLQGVASGNGSQSFALNGFNQTLAGLGCTTTFGSATQHKVVGGSITLSTLTINDNTDRTFNSLLGGTGANENNLRIIKQGIGTWTLGLGGSGTPPTFTGGLWIQGGKVILTSGNFAPAGGWITIDPGAVLQCSQPGQANPTAGITNNGAWVVSRTGATTISVPIRGSGSVTNIGTGALTLGATNTYTGSTVILAGSLNLSTSKALGGGDLIIADTLPLGVTVDVAGTTMTNANLTLGTSGANTLTFNMGTLANPSVPIIRVPGSLSPNGTISITLTGTGLGAGTFTLIKYGTLGGGGFAAFSPTVTTPASVTATLVNNTTNKSIDVRLVATGVEVWNGNLTADWESALLNWTNRTAATATNYTGTRVVLFDDGAMGTTAVNLPTAVTPPSTTVSNNAKPYSFNSTGGYLSGAGPLIKQGTGPLTLSTPNDYAGNTLVQAGSVVLGASEVVPDGPGKGDLALSGVLDLNGQAETLNGLSGSGLVTNSASGPASLTVSGISGDTFGGTLRGAVNFTLSGGSQTLTGSNSYTGTTMITGGTLNLANPYGQCLPGDVLLDGALSGAGLGMGSPNQFSPTAIITMNSDYNPVQFTFSTNQTIGGLVSTGAGGNRLVQGAGVLTFNPPAGVTNDFEGMVYVRDLGGPLTLVMAGGGTQIIGTLGTPNGPLAVGPSGGLLISGGTMWFRHTVANATLITNNAALVFDLPYDVERATPIKGTGSITKVGGGVLWLHSSAAGTQFNVLQGTLGGGASITAPVTVASGARLWPSYSTISQLAISNTLTLAEGSQTTLEIDRFFGFHDSVVGMAAVNFGGTLTVNNLEGNFTSGDSYLLFSATSYSGDFSAFNLPALNANLRWSWNPNAGTLAVVPVATTPTNIVAVQNGSTLDLSWPADYTGWLLQVQTNDPGVGLTTNWSVWPGSATTNHVEIPLDPANGSVFFRLLLP